MKLKNISILLFSLFVTGVFAADLQVTEGETYFSITQKSDTEFTFINSVSEIKTKVIKTEKPKQKRAFSLLVFQVKINSIRNIIATIK